MNTHKGIGIFSLHGKNALITGATGHLGSAMATILAEAGAQVYINSRSEERSQIMVSQLQAEGLSAEMAVFDVTSPAEINKFALKFSGHPLHILINNAYTGGAGSIEKSNTSSYAASYDVTVAAAHRMLQTFLPNLRLAVEQAGDASVINLASMYALVSPDQRIYASLQAVNPAFYGAAKAALLHWTRYAACEFGKEHIRVNSITPGPFPSSSVQESDPDFIRMLRTKVPMGTIGTPEQIKGPILFLASSAASFVNGSNVVVDGGWTCW